VIKSIRLENFQAHKETVLELHPGVNVIAGSSNSGKSSILRALNWAVYNRPSGDAFVSHWARDDKGNQKGDTSVTLTLDNGTIERRKSKSTKNTYKVNETVLEAIGLDVPEEVSKALNFTEVNTQRQHDAPFLLSDSPGEVARFFNKIVHFDAIDQYLSALESKKRKAKADAENAKKNAERIKEELEKYTWVKQAEKLIDRIGKKEDTFLSLCGTADALDNDITRYGEAEDLIEAVQGTLKDAGRIVAKLDEAVLLASQIGKALPALQDSVAEHHRASLVLEASQEVDYAEKLCRKIERKQVLADELDNQASDLLRMIGTYIVARDILSETAKELEALEAELPDVCPLCGKEM
jgi:exonuclease SbcC